MGKKEQNWEHLYVLRKRIILRNTWMIFKWLEDSRIWLPCEEIDETWSIWENHHHLLTTCIWDVLNVNANRTKLFLKKTEKCSNHEFLQDQLGNCVGEKNPHAKNCRVLTRHGVSCAKNALKDFVNFRMERQNNGTESQLFSWTTTISSRTNWKRWETCPQCARR